MLKEIKEQFKGSFHIESVSQLERMESDLLYYDHFSSEDAFRLGTEIVRQSKTYGEDIVVRVLRCSDDLTIFQYVGSSLSQRNLDFAMRKHNTVVKTSHCSLWALAKEETLGGLDAVFAEDSGCLPVGGAFPIFEKETLTAILSTSGLHHGKDHEVVVKALCELKGIDIPAFNGILI